MKNIIIFKCLYYYTAIHSILALYDVLYTMIVLYDWINFGFLIKFHRKKLLGGYSTSIIWGAQQTTLERVKELLLAISSGTTTSLQPARPPRTRTSDTAPGEEAITM